MYLQVSYAEAQGDQITSEESAVVKVIGKFNNEYLGRHHFVFKDGQK